MRRAIKRIDVTNLPDLVRLAEEVRASQEPRMLTRDHEALAILMPAGAPVKRGRRRLPKGKTKADYEAFRSAAGGWKDVDTDKLLEDIYRDRDITTRPPIEL